MSVERQVGAYASYVAWCQKMNVPAANFADWYQHTATLDFMNQVVEVLSGPESCEPGYEITHIP
jgi:hypothetical protein